jgi:hypothetical protein
MFKYEILFRVTFEDKEHDAMLEWESAVQLRAGDTLHIGPFEELGVTKVVWFTNHVNFAFVELEAIDLDGSAENWETIAGRVGVDFNPPLCKPAAVTCD